MAIPCTTESWGEFAEADSRIDKLEKAILGLQSAVIQLQRMMIKESRDMADAMTEKELGQIHAN